jgi:hypothetical protein
MPRTIVHAQRRAQQLDHEIESIRNARNYDGRPTPDEVDLSREWGLLLEWITQQEAMPMTKKHHEREPLTQQEIEILIGALRVAASAYENDEKTFRQASIDIGDGKAVPMFASGDAGVRAAKRLADQFYRQGQDAMKVLAKLEGDDE